MIIPWQALDPNTLQNIIEYFVLREGTGYGQSEKSVVQKVDDVRSQLAQDTTILIWSELHKTVDTQQNTMRLLMLNHSVI